MAPTLETRRLHLDHPTIVHVTTRLAFTVQGAAEGPERLALPQFERRLSIRVETQS